VVKPVARRYQFCFGRVQRKCRSDIIRPSSPGADGTDG